MTWLIGLLVTVIICLVGACLTMLGWILASKDKVTEEECEARMLHAKNTHNQYCPENRKVLTKADHDELCDLRIQSVQSKIVEVKASVDSLNFSFAKFAEEQSVCRDNVRKWINEAMRDMHGPQGAGAVV